MLALVAAVAVAGCGGDEEGKGIPASTASALEAQLDNVQARIDQGSAGACRDILEGPRGPNQQTVQDQIDSLPDDVDPDVKSALQDSFDHLWDLVEQDCDEKAQQEEEQQPEETTPEETPTQTETETSPPETETMPPPTETTPPSEEELPPEGNGNGGGALPGTGNGGGVGPSGANKEKKEK